MAVNRLENAAFLIFRFPKTLKLIRSADFTAILKNGKKQPGRYFAVFSKPNGLAGPRLGLIVGKKAIRQATLRNRVKRLCRESFRLNQHGLNGLDVVIIIYAAINQLTTSELRQCVDSQWQRLK